MSDPFVHINRKFKIPLSKILKIIQKKNGKTWVKYIDPHFAHPRIAIHKGEARSLLLVVNTALIMRGDRQMKLEIEE